MVLVQDSIATATLRTSAFPRDTLALLRRFDINLLVAVFELHLSPLVLLLAARHSLTQRSGIRPLAEATERSAGNRRTSDSNA